MPLWFFPALLALFAVVSLAAAVWLLLHMNSVARVFRKHGDIVPGRRTRGEASRMAVYLALFVFNAGWISCVIIWIFAISGDLNRVVDANV